jgi:hypothetical protein
MGMACLDKVIRRTVNWIQSVLDWFSATVTDVQGVDRALSKCEQNTIDVWWMTIEQMMYFKGTK